MGQHRIHRSAAERLRHRVRRRSPRGWLATLLGPVFWGAALVAAMTAIRIVFVAPWAILLGRWRLLAESLGVVVFGALGGAIGGATYAVVGRPVQRWGGPLGPYLAGIVTVAGYITGLALMLPHIDAEAGRDFAGAEARLAALVVALIFGPIVGHTILKDVGPPAT